MRRIYLIFTVLVLATIGMSAQNILFQEDFESSAPGWSTDGSPGVSDWQIGTNLSSTGFTIPAHTNYAASNDNACVCNLISDIYISPEISFGSASGLKVSFDSYLPNPYAAGGFTDSKGYIMVFQGSTWTQVAEVTANTNWTNVEISLDGFVTGNAKLGFKHSDQGASTTGWAIDNVVVSAQWDYDLGVMAWSSPMTGCLSNNADVVVVVKNFGSQTITSFDIYYTLDGVNSAVQTVSQTILSGDTYSHSFSVALDLAVGVGHTFNATVALNGFTDQGSANNSFGSDVLVKRFATLPFSFVEGFSSNESYYWSLDANTNGNAQFVNETVKLTGNGAIGWVGGINTTTASNAWNDNSSYHSMLELTCNSGMVSVVPENLELVFDLRQETHYSLKYCWFGVFVNGTQIANTLGVMNFNPLTQNSDLWKEQIFNLSAYAGTAFTVELKASCQYADDIVLLDNVVIRPRNEKDAGVSQIIDPKSNCGLASVNNITVVVKNYGVETISNIPVWYTIDGGATEYYAGTVPGPILAGGVSSPAVFPSKPTPGLENVGLHQFTAFTKLPGDVYYPGNDALTIAVTNLPVISDFPYSQDFESVGYWTPGGVNSSWELGTPDPLNPVINIAGSGVNSWMTNLNGNYNNDEDSYLLGPCFDFTTMTDPSIDFKIWYHTDAYTDGLQLQSSVNNGSTWEVVGTSYPAPNLDNWYNYSDVSEFGTGQPAWTDVSGGWITAHHSLASLAQEPNVKLRFVFKSDGDNLGGNPQVVQDYDGIAIDDISISDPQATNDIRVMEWLSPLSGYYMTANEVVSIRVKNLGLNTITSFSAYYSLDGGVTNTTPETFSVNISTNGYAIVNFTQTANFAAFGTYPCEVTVVLPADENGLNNMVSLNVVSLPSISMFPYYEDFQTVDHFWTAGGTNSSWEFGIPAGSTIPVDPGDINPALDSAWVTNLDGVYNNSEFSWVESPLMDFSSLIIPSISMRIAYDAEGFVNDGACVQYSIGGGAWTTVGTLGVPPNNENWYINFVDGLAGEPGWTDYSNGWKLASQDLPIAVGGQTDVKIRVLFGSDANTVLEGMAFDDVTIFENAPHDLAVTEWSSQSIACGLSTQEIVTVKIDNLGYFDETNFDIKYTVNGTSVTETVTATILAFGSDYFSFATPVDMSAPGVYTCSVEITTADYVMGNNLLNKSILSSPLVSAFPYLEDFEGGNGNWVSGGANSTWNLGTPNAANPFITAAGSGVNSWVTNLHGDYNPLEESYVESPCFNFQNVGWPAISFQFISDCEFYSSTFGFDGAILEYSTDGGYIWTRVGDMGDTTNWYNMQQVWSFSNTEAWGGQSTGWVTAGIDMFYLGGEPNVKFRFKFASDDYNYPAGSHYDGFGFDDIFVFNNAPYPILTYTSVDNICYMGTDGSINVTITGGNPPFTFIWDDGATTEDRSGLAAGTYSVTLTDANLNVIDTFMVIGQGSPYYAMVNVTQDVSCYGGSNGALEVVVATGNPPYTYLWDNGATDSFATGLSAGTYCVTVWDADGCVAQGSSSIGQTYDWGYSNSLVSHNILIDVTAQITVDGTPVNPNEYLIGAFYDDGGVLECAGYAQWTGAVAVFELAGQDYQMPDGFASGEAFTWKMYRIADGATLDATATYNYPDTYFTGGNFVDGGFTSIAMLDGTASMPSVSASVCGTLSEPDDLVLTLVPSNHNGFGISCNGGSNGQIVVSSIGGTAPYTYAWSNSVIGANNNGLMAGTYTVTATDVNGCTKEGSVTLTEPAMLTISTMVTDVSCNGYSDGAINLTVGGGVMPFAYSWNTGANSAALVNVPAGSYMVTVTDANGCSITASATLMQSVLLPLQENFEAGVLPAGWQSTHATPSVGWEFGNNLETPITFEIPSHTVYAGSNDDKWDDYTAMVNDASMDYLITPPMDLMGYSTVNLTFDAFYSNSFYGSVATIEISLDGGTTWTVIHTLSTDANWQEDLVVSLSAYVNMCNVRLAFHHNDGGNWASGFAIDNVNIVGTVHDLELTAWVSPTGENCGLTNSEQVSIQVTNLGGQAATGFDLYYILDGTTYTETYTGTLSPSQMMTYSFAAIDLSAFVIHTASAGLIYTLDEVSANDMVTGIMFGNHPTISSFPYLEDFEDNEMEYFGQTVGADATSNIVNNGSNSTLVVTGQNPNAGWFGGINATANDAWNLSASHQVSALTWCSVDATGLGSLELLIDLQQMFANGPSNSWFRVLINGTQVGPDYNPATNNSDPMVTVQWDLDAYANTIFDLTLQFSNRSLDDKVMIDNIILRQKIVDVAAVAITSPMASCQYSSSEVVTVSLENLGGLTASGFDVVLDVDGVMTTETYNGVAIIPGGFGTHTFTATADLSVNGPHTISVDVNIANDVNTVNDVASMNILSTPYYNTYPFAETAVNFGSFWTAGGTNSSWVFGTDTWSTIANAGSYYNEEMSWVVSPCFNFASLNSPVIEFDLTYQTEPLVDAVVLQYSTDGITWITIGSQGDNDNWYNGAMGWNGPSGGMLTVRHELFGLAGMSNVQFRMFFNSDDDTNMNGISFSNVEIYEQNDIGAIASAPTGVCAGSDFSVDITIQNFGYSVIPAGAMVDVQYTLNGNTVSEMIALTSALNPGGTAMLSFAAVENMMAGTYSIDANATMVADFNAANNAMVTGSIMVYTLPVVSLGPDVNICNLTSAILDAGTWNAYLWSDGSTDQTLTVSLAGVYGVTVTDANGCMNFDDIAVGIYPLPVVDLGADIAFCDGLSATLDAGQFVSYLWSDGSANQTLAVSAAGTYSVTVTDANGCQGSDAIVVSVYPLPSADAGLDQTICFGESTTLTATGGDSYVWSNGETTASIVVDPAITSTYTVVVTETTNGCSASDVVVVNLNYGPVIDNALVSNVTCFGYNNGTIALAVSGGVTPYTYIWSNSASSFALSNLTPGTYDVTITDGGSCDATASYVITEPSPVLVTVIDISQNVGYGISCFNTNDGNVMALSTNGIGTLSYLWSNGETTQAIDNLSPGTYTVTVTDANGCMGTGNILVTEPPELTATVSTTDITCYGYSNGTATVFPLGGTPPYDYLWSNNATTQTVNNLGPDLYSVWVSDANGCVIVVADYVVEPPDLLLTGTVNSDYNGYGVSCYGASNGSATVTNMGGIPPYTVLWSNGATTNSISNLVANTYTVTVTDMNACVKTTSVVITQPNPLLGGLNSPLHTSYNISCFGGSDGAITVNVNGGVQPYIYIWSNGATGTSITGLPAGSYSVTATDANGCSIFFNKTLTQPSLLTANAAVNIQYNGEDVSCFGGSDGQAIVNVTGGVSLSTVLWSNNANTLVAIGLASGSYTVTVTDNNGCMASSGVTLTDPIAITGSSMITSSYGTYGTHITCFGSTDGSALATASGGTGTLSYIWSNGQNTAALTNVGSGTYTVSVTDSNNCLFTSSVEIVSPDEIVLVASVTSDYNGEDVSCFGSSDGTGEVIATGGTGTLSYLWSTGAITASVSGLMATTYTVTVTDENGCEAMASISLTEPTQIVGYITVSSDYHGRDVSCNGASDGSLLGNPSMGTPPYTYSWSTGGTGIEIFGLSAGFYALTIHDANGCPTAPMFKQIQETPLLVINGTASDCFAAANGWATATPQGGTAPYAYSWSDGQTTQTATGLVAGSYDVTVTDVNGCTETHTYILSPLQVSGVIADIDGYSVSCFGGSDGSIDLSPVDGVSPYLFSWDTGENTEDVSGLMAGMHYVTVTDDIGCAVVDSFLLTEPDPLQAVASVTSNYNGYDISCPGAMNGAITVDVLIGFSPYTYVWKKAGQTATIATTKNVNYLVAGTYNVTVTDVHGCTGTASVTLEDPTPMDYTAVVTDAACNGSATGSIDITVSGGASPYLYFWNFGPHTQDVSNLAAGTYYVLMLDANMCFIPSDVFVIGQPTTLVANAMVTTDFDGYSVSCYGATDAAIDLTVSGGTSPYDFAWSNSESTEDLSNVGVGMYEVTVTDFMGCSTIVSVQVTEPDLFVATAVIDTDFNGYAVSCDGATDGEVSVTLDYGFSPYIYLWSNGSTEAALIGVGVGTYDLTVTDNHNCVSMSSVTLTGADMLTISATIMSDFNGYSVSCNGAANGEIMVTVADGTSPYTYMWTNGETTMDITNAMAGDNTVTITDANGCTAMATVTLTEPAAFIATAVSGTLFNGSQISCPGESDASINLTVTGGVATYAYLWSNGATTEDLSGLGAGTYSVTVTDMNGCVSMASLTIVAPTPVVLNVSVFNTPCYGTYYGSATANASGGTPPYNYYWSNYATTQSITGMNSGTFYVYALDQNLCASNSYPITFVEPTEMVVTSTIVGTNNCYGNTNGAINLTVTGGTPFSGASLYTYSWVKTGQAGIYATTKNISNLGAGTYTCTIKDANNCTKIVSQTITQPALISLQLVETHVNCYAEATGSIMVTVTNGVQPLTYNWSNGATVEDLVNITGGFYFLTVTDATGCTAVSGKFISEPNELILSLVTTDPSCNGSSNGSLNLSVTGGTAPYTYLWTNGATTQDISGLAAGFYEVTVTDNHGCTERIDDLLVEPDVLTIALTGIDVNCNAGGNGTIDLTVAGGTAPYIYLWSNSSTTQDISVTTSGTFSVTVTDANGCTANGSQTLGTASAISLAFTSTNVSCNGGSNGSISVAITNGVAPYATMWSGPGIGQSTPFDWTYNNTGSNHSILVQSTISSNIGGVPLAIGDYIGVFYDTLGPELLCGGYFEWTGNSVALAAWGSDVGNDGFATGETFKWKVYRAADGMVLDAEVSYMTMANSDTYATNGVSGISSITAGMGTTISGLAIGTYIATVYDAAGCYGVGTRTITQPSAMITNASVHNVTCNGLNDGWISLVVLSGTPPYTYMWSNGTTTLNPQNLAPGTYTVTVTDANGCTKIPAAVTITEPAVLDFTWTTTDVVCNGLSNGTAVLNITGGTAPYVTNWAGFNPNALAAGNYTVVVSGVNGCSVTHTITIGQPAAIAITDMVTNISCFGAQDGMVDISVAGGITPYMYLWSNGETTEDLSGLDAGIYDLTVTDANLCVMMASISITQPDMLTLSGTETDLLCYNVPIGSIDVTVAGGTMPYSFAWSNGETTEDLSGLYAGMYSLTVTDAHGCAIDMSFDIVEPAELMITAATVTNVTCFAGSDGAVDITVDGGVLPYSFIWSNGSMMEDVDMLVASTYDVTVTDANGCSVMGTYIVTEPLEIMLAGTVTNISCYGFADGAIDLTVTNGVSPFMYAWSNGDATEDLAGLLAGTYEVVVTDASGCTANMMFAITQPVELSLTSLVNNVSCFGMGDGSIDISVLGGTTPYTYQWGGYESTGFDWDYANTGTNHTIVISNTTPINLNGMGIAIGDVIGVFYDSLGTMVCAGYVTWTGTNTNVAAWGAELNQSTGQTIMNGFAISEEFSWKVWQASTGIVYDAEADFLPGFLDSMYYVTDGSSGLASLTGTIPYEFTGSAQDLFNLVPGAYHVIVTDDHGCELQEDFIITQPDEIMVTGVKSNFSGFGVSACGATDGAINLTVSGGVAPLSFAWSNGSTLEDLAGLGAGTYTVNVSDANGCMGYASFNITEFCDVLYLSAVPTHVTCNGANNGSINLTLTGGLAPFAILWSNGMTTEDIYGLAAGTYTVTVTDAYSQMVVISQTITQPNVLSHTASIYNATCSGCSDGAIDITISGGTPPYSYAWSNGAVTEDATLLPAGLYGVQVTDANGCTYYANFGIVAPLPSPLTIVSIVPTNIVCDGASTGAIDLTVTGGVTPYGYQWSNGATTQDLANLSAGTYTVTVTDYASVVVTGSANVAQIGTAMSSTYVATPASSCNAADGAINITVTGGTQPYSFLWSNGATQEDLSGIMAGSYDLTVTDANGCEYLTTANVDALGMSASALISNNVCNGDANGQILLFVSAGAGPYTYLWSNGGTDFVISSLVAGSYGVTITDAGGCTLVESYAIVDPAPIIVTITPNAIGLSATVVSGTVGSYTYMWSNGKPYQSIKGLTIGQSYCVTVTDSNGCTGVACATWQTAPTVALNGSSHKDEESSVVLDQSINLYPNPTKDGKFYIDLNNLDFETLVFEVMDATGRVIYNQKVEDNSNRNVFVEIENATVGVYFLKVVTDANAVITKRIVIVK